MRGYVLLCYVLLCSLFIRLIYLSILMLSAASWTEDHWPGHLPAHDSCFHNLAKQFHVTAGPFRPHFPLALWPKGRVHESWNSLSQTFHEHVYDFAVGSIQRTAGDYPYMHMIIILVHTSPCICTHKHTLHVYHRIPVCIARDSDWHCVPRRLWIPNHWMACPGNVWGWLRS